MGSSFVLRPGPKDLLGALALLAEAHLLGQFRTGSRIVRCNHRVIGTQVPLLAVLFRGHVVVRAQVALQRLELLAVFETDDVIGRDRLADRS